MGGGASRIAKITPPRSAGALLRPRLFRNIDRQRHKRVLWLQAPPGAGKTTLAATYLKARRLPALWCALDAADADLATFFHYLGLACSGLGPRRRAPLPAFTPDRRLGVPVFTRLFFEQVGARLPPRGVLVLDNYQDVPDGTPLSDVLAMGLASLREGQRVLVLSREAPPPPMARLEAAGVLARFKEDELRLTFSEARAIVRQRPSEQYRTRESLQRLHERTGGWVAGLLLFLEEARAVDPTRLETPEVVFDYLGMEYLDHLPDATRDLLYRVAVPPWVDVFMASALADNPQAGVILLGLARRGAFVTRRDGGVYELHPLLRELCQVRGEHVLGAAEIDRLRRLAASLCTQTGNDEAAADLHERAEDWPSLCALACARAPSLLAQGRDETLDGWLGRLPRDWLEREPWAAYWRASCRVYRSPLEARELLVRAFERFGQLGDRLGQIAAWSGIVASFGLAYDDMAPLDPWIAAVEGLLPEDATLPPAIAAAALASVFTAMNFRQPHHPARARFAALAIDLIHSGEGDPGSLGLLGYTLTINGYWLGEFPRARVARELLGRSRRAKGVPPAVQLLAWSGEAVAAYYEGDFPGCFAAVEKGLELAHATGIPLWDGMLHAFGAYAALASYDPEDARRRLESFAAGLQPGLRRLERGHHGYLAAWEALVAGNLSRALDVGRSALSVCVDLGTPYPEAQVELVLAEVHAQRRETDLATRALDRAREVARACGSYVLDAQIAIVEAQLALARPGGRADAERHLGRALGLAREVGLPVLMTFAAPAHVLHRLCVVALEAGIEVETARALLRARPAKAFEPPASLEPWPWSVRVQLLGGFRVEVNGRPLRFSRKVQRRPLELLQLLVAEGGSDVSEGRVLDLLWPDSDGDKAERAFGGALHRLRALLGDATLVRRQAGLLSLDKTRMYSDVWAVSDLCQEAASRRVRGEKEEAGGLERQALALYRGPLLPEERAPWAGPPRERLAARLARVPRAASSPAE